MPPAFCASAITCKAMVVLPEDSGPKISTTRQRGVERNRARRNHRDRDDGFLRPQPHNGPFAELLFNLCEGEIDCLDALVVAICVALIVAIDVALFRSATLFGHNGCS